MALTVRDTLTLGPLRGTRVLAGADGLDHCVDRVSVLEVPKEVDRWLVGGEFIVTSFYNIRSVDEQVEIIRSLARAGAGALCVHPCVVGDQPLERLIGTADEVSLPLLLLPVEISYATVISAVLGVIVNRQASLMQHAKEINQGLVDAILSGGGLPELARRLASSLGTPMAILDEHATVLAAAELDGRPRLTKLLDEAQPVRAWLGQISTALWQMRADAGAQEGLHHLTLADGAGVVVVPVLAGREPLGFVLGLESEWSFSETDAFVLFDARTLIALELRKQRAVWASRQHQREDFLQNLLNGNYATAAEALEHGGPFGYSPKGFYIAVEMETTFPEGPVSALALPESSLTRLVDQEVRGRRHSLSRVRGDLLLLMLHSSPETAPESAYADALRLAQHLQTQLQQRWSMGSSVGIGSPARDPLELVRSYGEARQARLVGKRLYGSGHCTVFRDLGVYRWLDRALVPGEVQSLTLGVLEPLMAKGELTAELLRTLEVFLDCQQSVKHAAEALYVHPNTVKYRVRKILDAFADEGILEDSRRRLELHLALKARRLM